MGNVICDLCRKPVPEEQTQAMIDNLHGGQSIVCHACARARGMPFIPDQVVLHVPVFQSVVSKIFPVNCALEINPADAEFQIIPLPGEVESVIQQGEAEIGFLLHDLLKDSGVPMYYGTP